MHNFTIRKYQETDFEPLVCHLTLLVPDFFAEEEIADYREYLQYHKEDYFVVEYEGERIGAGGINYFYEEQTARLSWDFVCKNWQGKGVGAALTRHRIDFIHQYTDIRCIVVRTSQMAWRFYEKMGFRLEKTIPDYWAEGFDLYQMVRNI